MPLHIHLLGAPSLIRDGDPVHPAPRGRKAWALLAYLLLAERSPSRQHLVDLLFTEADDPAGALRWNLSELRRILAPDAEVGGRDRVAVVLAPDCVVDVQLLASGSTGEAVRLPGLGHDLLEGIQVEASPGFEAWLLNERRRLLAMSNAVLREGALRRLAVGDADAAVALAQRLVEADPLSEDAHALLIRSFAATGDPATTTRQVERSSSLFRDELGLEVAEMLEAAAVVGSSSAGDTPVTGRAGWRALLESSEAAAGAGAVEVAFDGMRRAAAGAQDTGDTELESRANLALGTALVHAARGRDEEGAAALHRAIAAADRAGLTSVAAAANRELGYVELLRGDYPRAGMWLRDALELAGDDLVERSRVRGAYAACLADTGAYGAAAAEFAASIDDAERSGQRRQMAWSLTWLGQSQLLRAQDAEAGPTLERALALALDERWTAFVPAPEALLGEVHLRAGDPERAEERLEHAFALGCQIDDACWEAYAMRGLGLLHAARGDLGAAVEALDDAGTRCDRQSDTHRWVRGYALTALCAAAVADGHPSARAWVSELESLAGRHGWRDLMVHAYLHRRDLGDPAARETAASLATEVDNPHLAMLLGDDAASMLDDLLGRSAP